MQPFSAPVSYYHRVEDGESWEEEDKETTIDLSCRGTMSAAPLEFVARHAAAAPQQPAAPVPVHILVEEGAVRWWPWLVTVLLLSVIPALVAAYRFYFRRRHWEREFLSPFHSKTVVKRGSTPTRRYSKRLEVRRIGTRGQGDEGQGDEGTRGQGDKGTRGQGDGDEGTRGTRGQGDEGRGDKGTRGQRKERIHCCTCAVNGDCILLLLPLSPLSLVQFWEDQTMLRNAYLATGIALRAVRCDCLQRLGVWHAQT